MGNPSASSFSLRERASEYFASLQQALCAELEETDGKGKFKEDVWKHAMGGGGSTRVMESGALFEKAGVNFSAVESTLSETLAARMNLSQQKICAAGISLILHPYSPMIPTVHMNLRHLELSGGDAWFGGGMDLTPYYLFEEDARHFHRTLQAICDRHDPSIYSRYKRRCDEYFFLKHRGETRGIGGIFFDYLRTDFEKTLAFVRDVGQGFTAAYLPIAARRRNEPWGEKEKQWQRIRRGRYVEFNLLYDRGTLFGLETNGRTESILMSLPPDAMWTYDHHPVPGSREEALLTTLHHPREWV